jgi:predicted nucleic acid-binding protein
VTFVLDASVALAWIFERAKVGEAERAQQLLDGLDRQPVIVPPLWHIEILNALVLGQRRNLVTRDLAADFLLTLRRMPIETDVAIPPRQEYVLALAMEHRLTAYDAIYLELALRHRAALATFDRDLATACGKVGVPSA